MGSQERLSTRRGQRWLIASLAIVIITRTPFLFLGYGADEDSWRVAEAASDLQETGHYHVSRFPGYPLFELLSAALVALAGPVSTNAATIVAALACVAAWHLLIQRRLQHPGGLTVLFAAMPLFWMSSAATTEHPWSILFQILTLETLLRGNYGAAGLCAGAVLGFRPPDAAGVVPLLTLFFLRRESLSRWVSFAVPFLGTVALAFLPVLSTYGLSGWVAGTIEQGTRATAGQSLALLALAYRSVYAIGPLAVLCLAVAAGTGWQRVSAALRRGDELTTVAVLGLLSVILTFALFPIERAYLLPGLPYLLILLERSSSPRLLAVTGACMISFAFVNPDILRHEAGRWRAGFNLRPGLVLSDWSTRQEMLSWRTAVAQQDFPSHTVIMTGVGPSFWLGNQGLAPTSPPSWFTDDDRVVRSRRDVTVLFLPVLNRTELEGARADGFTVIGLARNQAYVERVAGYRLDEEGVPVQRVP